MNKRDYLFAVDALRAPAALRAKIAALPGNASGARRPRRAVLPWALPFAAALVLVVGLGVAGPALLRAFAPEGGELTPPTIVTEAPAILDEELTELLAAQIPDPRSDVEPELLYAVRRGGRTLGVLRYYAETPEGGAMSLILGLFDDGTKTIADDFINVIPGTDGEVCAWEGEDGPLYLLWTNYTVPEGIEKHVAGLYAMYDDGSVLAAELPSDILDQPDVPGEAVSMFHGEGPSVFWDDHLASIVPDGLELYVRTPGWSDGSQDMAQWTYLGLIPLPLTFSSPYSNLPPQEIQGVAIDELDYGALEGQMSAGEWAALEGYLPVLRDGQSFRWVEEEVDDKTAVKKPRPEELTLEQFYKQRFGLSLPDGKLDLDRLTLLGFSGDGSQDLILCFFNGGGNYLILHREGEEFYGTDMGYRGFEQLQTDGVFMGSAGAWYNFYYRLQFRDGRFEKELLGYQNNGTYEIGGIAVSEDYFVNWRGNLMASNMWWYYPAERAAILGVRAFLKEYPISSYGPSEYSDYGILTCTPVSDYRDPEFPDGIAYHVILQHSMMERYFLFDRDCRLLGTRSIPEFTLTIDGKAYPLGIGTRGIFGTPTGTNSVPMDDGQWRYEDYSEWFAPAAGNSCGYNYYPDTGEYRLSGIGTLREDVYTHRGIHVGSTVAELLAAYPECDTDFGDQTSSLTYSYNNSLNLEFYFRNDPTANRETLLARKIERIHLTASFW